jgi:hypothetical protein
MSIDDAISNLVTRVKNLEKYSSLEKLEYLIYKHYRGDISILDYYKVGDIICGVPLSNDSLNEVVDLVVIGVEHDTINGSSTKAALTLSQVNCLNNTRVMNGASGSGYTKAKYSTSEMRTWINDTYYNALPSALQSLIKTVDKTTNEAQSSGTVSSVVSSTEKCFLPSCYEMFGTGYSSYFPSSDGTQYEYYKTASNRKSYLGRNGNYFGYSWTRSGFLSANSYTYFTRVESDGSVGSSASYNGGSGSGVRPAFCI